MKKNYLISFSALIFIAFSYACFGAGYSSYSNETYNYKIFIPDSWKQEELTLPNKHFMYASKDADTEIKVRAFRSSGNTVEKMIHDKTWNLRKIDPGLNKIIETKQIKIKKNISGKLLIFEYNLKKSGFLQRALITQNNGIIYIIECRSPKKSFYKYDDIFTTAFASFKYLGNEGRNPTASEQDVKAGKDTETPEPAAQEPAEPEPDEEI
ncbi:MAG: hypothetical protein JW864_11975 [Spirochaetes bacterium]|nr:hypothetical protein [Spirochaetota bacterium]